MASTDSARSVWLVAMIATGCAVHRVGHVDVEDGQVHLLSGTGHAERLALAGDSRALGALDGHLVDLSGHKGFGAIRVGRWRAIEGPHGMQVWVGNVQRLGVQIGIGDEDSGQLLLVDPRTARDLAPHLGKRVAIEGYVEGVERIAVVDWVALE